MPTIIPKVIAKAKPLKTSPPKISTATILKSVVPEVFNVLERVLFNDPGRYGYVNLKYSF